MSNKKLLKGAFILALAGLAAKFLGVFFKIPLQRLIGDEGMGLFGLPYPLYTLMLSISITGFPAAISKLISERLAYEDIEGANRIFKISLAMLMLIGLFSSAFLFFGAEYIIALLNWPQDAYYSILGLSIAPLFVSIMSAFRGYFQGMQFMGPTAISQIVEQVGRVVIGVGLSYYTISMGIGYAAGAASFGASAGAILGVVVLVIYYFLFNQGPRRIYFKPTNKDIQQKMSSWEVVREIIWFAIPISIGGVLSSIMTLIDAVMVPSRLIQGGYSSAEITVLYGQLTGKAVTLVNVPLTFSIAMAASIIPAIAESYSKNNSYELKHKIKSAMKTTIIIALPAAAGLYLLAPQIIGLLWGQGEAGGHILRILSFNVIFISIGQILGSILQGMNRVYIPLRSLLIGAIIKVVVSYYLLMSSLNILGAVMGSIAGYCVVMVLNYIEVKKTIGFKIEIKNSILKPIMATIFMTLAIYYIHPWMQTRLQSENIATLISVAAAMIVYFLTIYISKAVDLKESIIGKR